MNRLFLIVIFIALTLSAAAQNKPASAEAQAAAQAAPRAPRSRTITGRVIDQNNAPLEDVTIVALPAGLAGMQQNATTVAKIRPTSTDEQGRFTLDNLPSGSYIL